MKTTHVDKTQDNRLLLALGGVFFIVLTIGLGVIGSCLLSNSHQRYAEWLSSDAHVIVVDTGTSIFYGNPLLLIGLFIIGCYGAYIGVRGHRNQWFDKHCLKPLGGVIVAGLVLMFVGKYYGNTYWDQSLKTEGYIQCNGSFALTGKWAIDVWAQSSAICIDPNLKDALRHSKGSVYEINDYYSPPENMADVP